MDRIYLLSLMGEIFASVDPPMSNDEFRILVLIAMHPGATQGDIHKKLGISQSKISRLVRTLMEETQYQSSGRGFITARPAPEDRRKEHLFLTQQGRYFIWALTHADEAT